MTALNKQALREAAEKATPGRWEYYPGNTSIEYNVDSTDEDQGSIVYVDSGDFTQKQTDLNGAFIASANPSTVLALLDELEAAERLITEWEQRELSNKRQLVINGLCESGAPFWEIEDYMKKWDAVHPREAAAAGIGVKGE
ncbi:ead/Ea22-like family protein [Citrobacter freundii]|uniref:ead/Ea22-like family protein n=1 Tax=Citrobacter freundii TaxID=546 RepID=UPI0035CF50C4